MSSAYRVIAGDTFSLIARKTYGIDSDESLIANANPGVTEPLAEGITIVIPDNPNAIARRPTRTNAVSENEVTLRVGTETLRFFTHVTISLAMDSFSAVGFSGPFDPDVQALRDALKPLSFQPITVDVGGVRLFTGTVVNITPSLSPVSSTINVDCYSRPGVTNDCTPPASASDQLEFHGFDLAQISRSLCAHFGISVDASNVGPVFEQTAINLGSTVYSYLVSLAKQRNTVISDTPEGKLLIRRPTTTGVPVATLTTGVSPLVSVQPQFNSQQYYSHITGMQPAFVGLPGSQHTIVNSRLRGVVRPWTFIAPDTEGADTVAATEAKAGRMFASVVTYSIVLATWRDPSGALWAPNTTIVLLAPRAMVYTSFEFLVRAVSFSRSSGGESATLSLILPGTLSGEIPEVMPWD